MSYTNRGRREARQVGFWAEHDRDPRPRPQDFVDHAWSPAERQQVLAYVEDQRFLGTQYRGWSNCRMCGKPNGSADYSDGTYVWPQGYGHYLREHGVKPPQDFIHHVLRKPHL